jgi:hypothetical protein
MDTDTILARAKRRYTRETLPTSAWEDLVVRGVAEYSRWNPTEVETTITTVASQAEYTVAEDCIGIKEVAWDSLLTVTAASPDRVLANNPGVRLHMPSNALIDDINAAEYARQVNPQWEWIKGNKKLRIDPTPGTGGDTVYVVYYGSHEATDGDYTTIPDEDLDIVVDLMLYELLGDRSLDCSLEPVSYQAGLEKENFAGLQENVAAARNHLLDRVQGKYGGTGGVLYP